MLCDYVQHSLCGEHVYVDEWEEHVSECSGNVEIRRQP